MIRQHDKAVRTLEPLQVVLSSLASVMISVVAVKGSGMFDFVDMTESEPISVRFIEFIPFIGFFSSVSN